MKDKLKYIKCRVYIINNFFFGTKLFKNFQIEFLVVGILWRLNQRNKEKIYNSCLKEFNNKYI